jgi:hypothetical protein
MPNMLVNCDKLLNFFHIQSVSKGVSDTHEKNSREWPKTNNNKVIPN